MTDEVTTTAPDGVVPAPPPGRIRRTLWALGGFVSVGLGSLGIIVPGFPTTVFFIVAAWCFSHGSPRFEQWVLNLPKIGPLVRDHRAGLGMSRRAKVIAVSMMATAIAISSYVLRDRVAVVAVIVALGLIGAAYIAWRVPTRERVLAERGLLPPPVPPPVARH